MTLQSTGSKSSSTGTTEVRKQTAAAFIRSLSAKLTLAEMSKAVGAAGYTVGPKYVYHVRRGEGLGFKYHERNETKTAAPVPAPVPVPVSAPARVTAPTPTVPADDKFDRLRKLILVVGLERTEEYIREMKLRAGIE